MPVQHCPNSLVELWRGFPQRDVLYPRRTRIHRLRGPRWGVSLSAGVPIRRRGTLPRGVSLGAGVHIRLLREQQIRRADRRRGRRPQVAPAERRSGTS